MFSFRKKLEIPSADEALPGRSTAIPTARTHFINGHALKGPYPDGLAMAMFGLGCFWGAERKFWELGDAVYVTAAGDDLSTTWHTRETELNTRSMLEALPPVTRATIFCVPTLAWKLAMSPVPRLNVPKLWNRFDPTDFPMPGVI